MSSLAPVTRAQALASAIEESIVAKALVAGDSLGTIEHWRTESGFARATVNEAMRLLADRGIAEIRPGRGGGIFVAPDAAVVRLRHTLLSVRGEAASVADALVVRDALEPLVVIDAARSHTTTRLRSVYAKLRQLEKATEDHSEFIGANFALHEAIAHLTPNELLRTMYLATIRVICEHATGAVSDVVPADSYRAHRIAVHVQLVEAIESGDLDRVNRAIADHAKDISS